MRRVAVIGACAAGLLFPQAGARAASTGLFIVGDSGAPIRQTEVPVRVSGDIEVTFHGDPAAGCETSHVCDTSGKTTWTPERASILLLAEFAVHHHREAFAKLFLGADPTAGSRTLTRVTHSPPATPPSTCTDGRTDVNASFDVVAHPADVTLGLNRPSPEDPLLPTRCGGPLDSDVARVLPARRMDAAVARRGGWTLDLSASRPFSSHGLTGIVESTVKLRASRGETSTNRVAPPRQPLRRFRTLSVSYRVERVAGTIDVRFGGLQEDLLCAPLGACGASGQVTLNPGSPTGTARLDAEAPATFGSDRLGAALGLRPGGADPRIQTSGVVNWDHGRGSASAAVSLGGVPACADRVRLAEGFLTLAVDRSTVRASYGDAGYAPDPLDTRCPGPRLPDVNSGRPLATGTLPLRDLGRRRVVLHLRTGSVFAGDGYRGRSSPNLTIVLRRTRVREETYAGYG